MSTKKIRVPEGMRAAGYVAAVENRGRVFIEPSVLHVMNDAILEAALRWLDDILNEADTDFHRAILKRGAERYGDGPAHGIQRVAFEFGCSFARQYIRSLFAEPETAGVDAATGKIIAEARKRAFDEIMACAKDEDIEAGIGVDAERVWALALQEREKHKNDPPKAIRHLICKPDGAWPPSRQLYNACIEDAYEIGKESREP